MDLTESTDDYEVFNQPSPPKDVPAEMGIQRKPQRSLQELLESQLGRGEDVAPAARVATSKGCVSGGYLGRRMPSRTTNPS